MRTDTIAIFSQNVFFQAENVHESEGGTCHQLDATNK